MSTAAIRHTRAQESGGRGVRQGRPLSDAARLDLVEFLLRHEDVPDCVDKCLEWLGEHTAITQALVAVVEPDAKRLVGAAGIGVNAVEVGSFVVELEERANPLVRALAGGDATYFPAGSRQPATPISGVPFYAFPLRSTNPADEPAGLLLVAARMRQPDDAVVWLAENLGEKLTSLRSRDVLAAAERRFERDRTLLTYTLNAVVDPILLTDTEGKLIIANARAERLFSAPNDASEGWRRAVALNNMLFSSALSGAAVERQEISRRELLLVDPMDGSDLLFELLASVVKDPREGTCIVSILRNVTDLGRARVEIEEQYQKLRQAETEARAERHRLELIIDSVADPILVTDAAGDIVLMNPPAERLFTLDSDASEEQVRSVRANDAHFSSFLASLLSGGEARHRGEIGLTDPTSGANLPCEAISGMILSDSGELTAVVTILHDRTEAIEKAELYEQVKRASDELEAKVRAATGELAKQNELLRRQAIQLEQASAAKSQFLANMSHEFRTPLNAILGYTSMLLRGMAGTVPPMVQRNLERVDSNGRHLLAIVNDILDITRIEAGRMPLRLETFDVKSLCDEVLAELEPIITSKPIPVNVQLPARLPQLTSDRQKVKQIVLNFLSNALKFTHQGSITLGAQLRDAGKSIVISVKDTGIGISRQDHKKIFEDFQQADNSPTRAYGGAGLGLSICRRLATMLDGHITLDSDVGTGSTFALHLPVKASEETRRRRAAH